MSDSDIIEEKDKILSFILFKLEKGKEKICKCNPPHYKIDTMNRIVTCSDCGAVLDAFDALVTLCKYTEEYEEYQRQAIEKINTYRELANSEQRRWIKNRAFKEMDAHYRNGMYPFCPQCGELFDPSEINRWGSKAFYELVEKKED